MSPGCGGQNARHPVSQHFALISDEQCAFLLQVRDTLGALADRCASLKIDGAALHVSRLLRRESRGLAVKRITMYSPNWVKSQNRMSSTSNQACRLAITIHKHFSRPRPSCSASELYDRTSSHWPLDDSTLSSCF